MTSNRHRTGFELLEQRRLLASDTCTNLDWDSPLAVAMEPPASTVLHEEDVCNSGEGASNIAPSDDELEPEAQVESETSRLESSTNLSDDDSKGDDSDEDDSDEDDSDEDDSDEDDSDEDDSDEDDSDEDDNNNQNQAETVVTASQVVSTPSASAISSETEESGSEQNLQPVLRASDLEGIERGTISETVSRTLETATGTLDAATVDLLLAIEVGDEDEPESTEFVGASDQRDALEQLDLAYDLLAQPKNSVQQ